MSNSYAYEFGFKAYQRGKLRDDNPYIIKGFISISEQEWADGWHSAQVKTFELNSGMSEA